MLHGATFNFNYLLFGIGMEIGQQQKSEEKTNGGRFRHCVACTSRKASSTIVAFGLEWTGGQHSHKHSGIKKCFKLFFKNPQETDLKKITKKVVQGTLGQLVTIFSHLFNKSGKANPQRTSLEMQRHEV